MIFFGPAMSKNIYKSSTGPQLPCAWCHPSDRPAPKVSHGICRKHELLVLADARLATPAEFEELWHLLEPRAFAWARINPISIAWAGFQKVGAWLISDEGSAAVAALTLSAAILIGLPALADWIARGFEIVGR